MSTHLTRARDLLHTDDRGSGLYPPVSPEHVALAQVHTLMAIAEELGRIRAALVPDPAPVTPGHPGPSLT
ncbi:MAG TPA: hypothetical protein VGH88_14310 [Streptosporangiaceae bacterium]|jgi:hypothetical protein